MSKYDWLEKRMLRSVDNLRLWPDNPRLDPEENHVSVKDFAQDLINDKPEKDAFLALVASIADDGFIPSDPIVIWKDESNEKYYVAEGNRRILALKLLRNPEKSPKSIRNIIRKKSFLIDREEIEKIRVCIAPSIDDCEWYINQRHAAGSLLRSWSRLQHQRWVSDLYDKYEGDIDKISNVTKLNRAELEYTLRILKVRDLAMHDDILGKLDISDQEVVKSHRIPMSILERWFFNPTVKERWGIGFEGSEIVISSNLASFYNAYSVWLKMVIHRSDPKITVKIDTRTITSDLDKILNELPTVKLESDIEKSDVLKEDANSDAEPTFSGESDNVDKLDASPVNDSEGVIPKDDKKPQSKNPDRNKIVVESCTLTTSNYKLDALFRELKEIPVSRYQNSVAAVLRVFLDLSVSEYISSNGFENDLRKRYNDQTLDRITLKMRLDYLKSEKLKAKTPSYMVVDRMINNSNEFSLDTMNKYVHGSETLHTNKRFLNNFWDFLFPLFEEILGMEEK